jgi:glucose/arabinose dehydrogenase
MTLISFLKSYKSFISPCSDNIKHDKKYSVSVLIMGIILLSAYTSAGEVVSYPSIRDDKLKVETVVTGLHSPTTMAFLGADDMLVLEKEQGTVLRIQNGVIISEPVLKVDVANDKEFGMLGINVQKVFSNSSVNIYDVFLRFTERTHTSNTSDQVQNASGEYSNKESLSFAASHLIDAMRQLIGGNSSGTDLHLALAQGQISTVLDRKANENKQRVTDVVSNKLYKYILVDRPGVDNGTLSGPHVILNIPVDKGSSRHVGGIIAIDPFNRGHLYTTVGDLDIPNRSKMQNIENGLESDGSAGILRISKNGDQISKGILGQEDQLSKYFAYGIRNSFGLAFDPVNGKLWDTENGPGSNDEINLVEPGFNSGWQDIMGLAPSDFNFTNELVNFDQNGHYSDPEFVWEDVVAPTAIAFLTSDKLGPTYESDMFVASSSTGNIYRFELNSNRTGLILPGDLADKVADFRNETEPVTFGDSFNAITDIKVGPDGYLYLVSLADGTIYRIVPHLDSRISPESG